MASGVANMIVKGQKANRGRTGSGDEIKENMNISNAPTAQNSRENGMEAVLAL